MGMVPYRIVRADNGDAWVESRGKKMAPAQTSAEVLKKMKQTAERHLGGTVDKAVITVPAYFNDAQLGDQGCRPHRWPRRGPDHQRAHCRGPGLRLRQEEDRHHRRLRPWRRHLDISILEIGDGVFEVKSTNGDTFLGGEDFDNRDHRLHGRRVQEEARIDLRGDRLALQRLKEAAEKAKIELSSDDADRDQPAVHHGPCLGPQAPDDEDQPAKLEMLVDDLIERTIEPCGKALKDAGLKASNVDEVILVGGMTRMPKVLQKVKEFFGKDPHQGVNPDEVVAVGAAIQAAVLSGEVKDVLLLDVTPLSLGIETLGGVFTRIIDRNTTIPTKKSPGVLHRRGQPVGGDHPGLPGRARAGGAEQAAGPVRPGRHPAGPRGVPQIEVTFDIDANGIVNVQAKDKATGRAADPHPGLGRPLGGRPDGEGGGRACRGGQEAPGGDRGPNHADSLIYSTDRSLKEHGDKVPASTSRRSRPRWPTSRPCSERGRGRHPRQDRGAGAGFDEAGRGHVQGPAGGRWCWHAG